MTRTASLAATLVVLAVGAGGQEPARRNFVPSPNVQDAKTVPCWLSEYEGKTYLPRHSDRHQRRVPSALPRPSGAGRGNGVIRAAHLRRHRAQARARIAAPGARFVVQHHPAGRRNQFTVPFAPRPPGPSGGRLAFQGTAPPPPARSSPPSGPREFTLQYDFDNGVMGRHAGVLGQILNQARASKADSGADHRLPRRHRLSDGRVMTERPDIGTAERGRSPVSWRRPA